MLAAALTDGSLKLRYVAGRDVEPLIGRHGTGARQQTVTDEQHVGLGQEMSEHEFLEYWRGLYSIDLSGTSDGGLAVLVEKLRASSAGLDGPRL